MRRRGAHRKVAAKTLVGDLAALTDLSREALKARWWELYGSAPPSRLGRALMVQAIAFRLQEKDLGALKPAIRRRLAQVAEEIAAGRSRPAFPATIKPGTRLLREWQGVTHEVIVLEGCVQYRSQTWRSLSAVAREITGPRWSGPLFFGLKGRRHVDR